MMHLKTQDSCASTELEDFSPSSEVLNNSYPYVSLKSIPEDFSVSSPSIDVITKGELSRTSSVQRGIQENSSVSSPRYCPPTKSLSKRFRSKSVGSVNSDKSLNLQKRLAKSQGTLKCSNSFSNDQKKKPLESARSSVASSRSMSPISAPHRSSMTRVKQEKSDSRNASRTSLSSKSKSNKTKHRLSGSERNSLTNIPTEMTSRLSANHRKYESSSVPLKAPSPSLASYQHAWKDDSVSSASFSMPELFSTKARKAQTFGNSSYGTSGPRFSEANHHHFVKQSKPEHAITMPTGPAPVPSYPMYQNNVTTHPAFSTAPIYSYKSQEEPLFCAISSNTIDRVKKHVKSLQSERQRLLSTIQSLQSKLLAYETSIKDMDQEKTYETLKHQQNIKKLEESVLVSKQSAEEERQRQEERFRNQVRDLELQIHKQNLDIEKLRTKNSMLKRECETTKKDLLESLVQYMGQVKDVSANKQQHEVETERMKKMYHLASQRIGTTNEYLDVLQSQLRKAAKTR